MKMLEWTQRATPFLCPVFVCLCAISVLGLSGCGDDEGSNDWVGTWKLDTVDGEDFEQSFIQVFVDVQVFVDEGSEVNVSLLANNWTFDGNGTFEMEFAFSYEAEEDGVQVEDINSMKIMGTYSLSGSNYTLTREKTTVSGGLFTIALILGTFDTEEDEADIETGTWSRKGDTLTLTRENDTVSVYKRK